MDGLFLNGCPNTDSEFCNTTNNTSQGNVAKSWQWQQLGMNPKGSASNKRILQEAAEDHLVNKEILSERSCEVPGVPRSTFLMVFSPDGTKVASTHGNHNVYVSELATGKHVKTLSGHPRTPWCIAFHPSHTQLLGSGCLGGEVRVWDLSGGSEVWTVSSETVIASIAFHPRDQLLVIATYNELYFWDWSQPQPFTKVQTNTIKEKVRFVSFDALGHKLITGISVWSVSGSQAASSTVQLTRPDLPSATDQTATYHQLLDRYNSLVRNYRRLIMAQRHSTTTTDRGTDPMETDWAADRPPASTTFVGRPRLLTRVDERETPTPPQGPHARTTPFTSRTDPWNVGSNLPGPSSSFTYAISLAFSPSPLSADGLFGSAARGSRQSAFRPLTEIRRRGPPASDSPLPVRRPPNLPGTASRTALLRGELTASLGRLQYFMEHSIDETLNIRERSSSGLSPVLPVLNSLYERSISRARVGPAENSASSTSRETSGLRQPDGRDLFYFNGGNLPGNSGTSRSGTGAGSRAGLFSSDDADEGSDSDREMFSPLPLHIYRTRNWNAPTIPVFRNQTDPPVSTFSAGPTVPPVPPAQDLRDREWDSNGLSPQREATWLDQLRREYVHSRFGTDTSEPASARGTRSVIADSSDSGENPSGSMRDVTMANDPAIDIEQLNMEGIAIETENERRSNEAFQKVILGVQAIQRHTESLIALCSENASRPPLLRLRRHWEDLRRDMIRMHRPSITGQGPPTYFSLSTRERCDLLTRTAVNPTAEAGTASQTSSNTLDEVSPTSSTTQPIEGVVSTASSDNRDHLQNPEERNDTSNTEYRNLGDETSEDLDMPSTSSGLTGRITRAPRMDARSPLSSRQDPGTLGQDRDRRRRLRAVVMNGISRGLSGMRRTIRSIRIQRRYRVDRASAPPSRRELEPTRDSVRMHARRVLSIMFSIMMQCLDTDRLGSQIIAMLKSLKRAIGLSSLLLSSHPSLEGARASELLSRRNNPTRPDTAASLQTESTSGAVPRRRAVPSWSDRVAVQISAANRNNSPNARHRREIYHKFKKAKALRCFQPSSSHVSVNRESVTAESAQMPSEERNGPSSSASHSERPSNSRDINVGGNIRPLPTQSSENRLSRDASHARIHSRLLLRRLFCSRFRAGDPTTPLNHSENQPREPVSDVEAPTAGPRFTPLPRIILGGVSLPRLENPDVSGEADIRTASIVSNVVVPAVRINDVPVYDVFPNIEAPRGRVLPEPGIAEYLQPLITPNVLSIDENGGVGIIDAGPSLVSETTASPVHRIQAWDFAQGRIPDISDANQNIVVHKCKIHNDASIDISRDGRLLVALLPAQRMRNVTHRLGIYSLDWNCLGECLYTALLEQNAVSVSLSPCARHLAVGLGSRRVSLQPYSRNGVMALIFRLGRPMQENDAHTRNRCLILIRRLEQSWDLGFTSLNCLRWAPQPGQGLVYANNTGQLKILS